MSPEGNSRFVLRLAAVGAVLALTIVYTVFFSPAGRGSETVTVRVEAGSGLSTISELLHDSGVVSQPKIFILAARFSGMERKLRSGDYELSPSWSIPKLLETLASGRGRMLSVTLPEGITVAQAAKRLDAAGITDGEAFLSLSGDSAFLETLGVPASTAEGFLFPETYVFAASTGPEEVFSVMVGQFMKVFRELAGEHGGDIDLLETVTLASIIERETALPEERPLVAAVFVNRLRLGYRLQSDPTVIYGLDNFDGNLTKRDLQTPSPYNTYLRHGLPPGPIANPGRGSLWAALNPAEADYLYFVSRNDGSHQFSRNLAEHNQAVRQYQLAGGRR